MKNPLEKKDNTALITSVTIGALAAGAIAWFYLTDSGNESLEALKHKIKDEAKELASAFISDKTGVHKNTVKKVADHLVK